MPTLRFAALVALFFSWPGHAKAGETAPTLKLYHNLGDVYLRKEDVARAIEHFDDLEAACRDAQRLGLRFEALTYEKQRFGLPM